MIEKKIIKILKSIIKNKVDFKKNKKLVAEGYLDSFSVLLLISKILQFSGRVPYKYIAATIIYS